MKACGIVAEYNPFHEGHIYQIKTTREALHPDVMIAVMSGNFVQRGEPAIVDKWTRAKAAIADGIDLVIELPYIYATQSANGFAHGAIQTMKTADVSWISFGSECGNLENLKEIADTPINPDHLQQMMNTGMSYPKAYSLLTHAMAPNDILAVSYLKEIANTPIEPFLVQRTNDYLDDQLSDIPSALSLRKALYNHEELPQDTPMKEVLSSQELFFMDAYYPYLRTYLITADRASLHQTFMLNEGIENHLISCALKSDDYGQFMQNAITSRYTAARIKRCCIQIMNRITYAHRDQLEKDHTLRVLAFNDQGRQWLKHLKDIEAPIANRFATMSDIRKDTDLRTCLLYTSCLKDMSQRTRILQDEIGGAQYIK